MKQLNQETEDLATNLTLQINSLKDYLQPFCAELRQMQAYSSPPSDKSGSLDLKSAVTANVGILGWFSEEKKFKLSFTFTKTSLWRKTTFLKVQARANELSQLYQKRDRIEKQIREREDQLLKMRLELANVSFQNIKFHEILISIRKSIEYMSDLRDRWNQISMFFQKLSLMTQETIAMDIEKMVRY